MTKNYTPGKIYAREKESQLIKTSNASCYFVFCYLLLIA